MVSRPSFGRAKALEEPGSIALRFTNRLGQERCIIMKKRFLVCALAIAVVGICGEASASILLDDFSADSSAKYVAFQTASYQTTDQWLTPTVSNKGGGLYWNGGEKMMPGDSASIDFQLDHNSVGGQGAAVGMSFTTDTSDANPYIVEARYVANPGRFQSYQFIGYPDIYAEMPDSYVLSWGTRNRLTLTRGTGVNQNVISWAFSQVVAGDGMIGSGSGTWTGLNATDGVYFGPVMWNTGTARPAYDNLTYTAAVPEPMGCISLATGLLGLLAYAWRKRK